MIALRKISLGFSLLILLAFFAAPEAKADAFTFNGALTPANPLQVFAFTVNSSSAVTIRGSANFDLALSLFSATGDTLNIGVDDDGLGPPFVALVQDEFGELLLAPGNYFLSVTPLPLLPGANLDEGFFFATDQFGHELTFGDFGFTGGTFTLEISGAGVNEAAPVPEPATMLLLAGGLTGFIAARRRKRFAR